MGTWKGARHRRIRTIVGELFYSGGGVEIRHPRRIDLLEPSRGIDGSLSRIPGRSGRVAEGLDGILPALQGISPAQCCGVGEEIENILLDSGRITSLSRVLAHLGKGFGEGALKNREK